MMYEKFYKWFVGGDVVLSPYGALLRDPHFFKFMLSNVLLDLEKNLRRVLSN